MELKLRTVGDSVGIVLPDYDCEFADIKGDLKLLKWMQGATFAGIVALLLRAFAH